MPPDRAPASGRYTPRRLARHRDTWDVPLRRAARRCETPTTGRGNSQGHPGRSATGIVRRAERPAAPDRKARTDATDREGHPLRVFPPVRAAMLDAKRPAANQEITDNSMPHSSANSRARHSSCVSPTSTLPPGSSQWPSQSILCRASRQEDLAVPHEDPGGHERGIAAHDASFRAGRRPLLPPGYLATPRSDQAGTPGASPAPRLHSRHECSAARTSVHETPVAEGGRDPRGLAAV